MKPVLTRRFPLGRVVATSGALETFEYDWLLRCLARHMTGDWGDLGAQDKLLNNNALINNDGRLFSAYARDGEALPRKLWIITEADRSVTTFLLPSEY